jgi:signal peptidase I
VPNQALEPTAYSFGFACASGGGSPRAFGVPEHVWKVTKSMSEGRVYRRKPWQAGVLSLFVPGLGQVYNGQARKGVLLFCLYGLGALAGLGMMLELSFAPWNIALPVGVLLAGYLAILVDAVTMARRQHDLLPRKFYNTVPFALLSLSAFLLWPSVYDTIRTVWVQPFKIAGGSMENTLLVGERLLVKKFRAHIMPPQRFAVIVFRYPWAEERAFVARVIALPGEQVQLRHRRVYVNEQPLSEPYAHYVAPGRQAEQFGPVRVPKRGDTIEIRSDQQLYVNGEWVPIPPGRYYPHDDGAPLTGFEVFYGPLFPEGATLRGPMGPFVVPDDYYFTLGDNRDNSKDSRYWGFVPHANILGVAKRLYWSWDRSVGRVRWERIGQDIR